MRQKNALYSYEDKQKAVELSIKYDRCGADVVHELGYPTKQALSTWIDELASGKRKYKICAGGIQFTIEQKSIQ